MKRIIVVLAMVAAPAFAVELNESPSSGWGSTLQCFDPDTGKASTCEMEPSNWHLLTKSHGGTVSLIQGLTKKECDNLALRLTPVYSGVCSGCIVTETNEAIVSVECFQ